MSRPRAKHDHLRPFSPEVPVFVAFQIAPIPAVLAVGRDYDELLEEVFELLGDKGEEHQVMIQKAPFWPGRDP